MLPCVSCIIAILGNVTKLLKENKIEKSERRLKIWSQKQFNAQPAEEQRYAVTDIVPQGKSDTSVEMQNVHARHSLLVEVHGVAKAEKRC